MAAMQAAEWQAGTRYFVRVGATWQAHLTYRGGWQGLRLMQFAFAGGLTEAMDAVPHLAGSPGNAKLSQEETVAALSYQGDTYLAGGARAVAETQ